MPSVLCLAGCFADKLNSSEDTLRRRLTFAAIFLCVLACRAFAQETPAPAAPERKVTLRVEPQYPELARKMRLQGVVKVEAMVRPNGSVRATRVLGGNPVLVEAAADAVRKWKFEAASSETTQVVELTFIPQ